MLVRVLDGIDAFLDQLGSVSFVPLGLAMGRIRAAEWFLEPLFSFGFPLPKIALIPLYVSWFGLFSLSKVMLIFTDCLFPIVIFTYHGARGVSPVYLWSAQARGYFSGRGRDAEVARCWGSRANAGRRARARRLGGELGVPAVTVALAWLLARPFPTHAVVGPATPAELDACLDATELTLPEDRLRWLAHG